MINNLKDKNNNPISYCYQYEYLNKKTKKNKIFNLWLKMTKDMKKNLTNQTNTQFFCDTTYCCVPPTFKHYKLFIISSYNFTDKNIYICAYCLIPNELEKT